MIAEISPNLLAPNETETRDLTVRGRRWRTARRAATSRPAVRRGRKLRLGIITGCPGAWYDGQIRVPVGEGRLMNALAERFPGTQVCIPVCDQMEHYRQGLDVDASHIVPLPPLSSTIKAQKYILQSRRIVREFAKTVDLLYINIPFCIPRVLKGLGVPKLMHVVGDVGEVVRVSNDYRGLLRLAARAQAFDMQRTLRQLIAEPATHAATHGKELWEKLGCRDGRVVISSCLSEHEMQPPMDRTLNEVPRLLFVGYLRPEKGVTYLLEAFHKIRAKRRCKLTLVGGADRTSRAQAEIHQMLDASPYRDDIELPGLIPFGKPLFDAYRNHDVYVQPSLSEGTPRTLIEARGFGCPVVATRVGGIPTSVDDGRDGLLVDPCNAAQLATAIERVLDDEPLRHRLIDAGIHKAKSHSLEHFADELAEELHVLGQKHVAPAASPAAPARRGFMLPKLGLAVNS